METKGNCLPSMAETPQERLHATARGKVQRVNFRAWTQHEARSLGLSGWVRNLSDGRAVEVLAEGPRPALEQLLRYLHEGPPYAMVTTIETEWGQAEGELPKPFRIA